MHRQQHGETWKESYHADPSGAIRIMPKYVRRSLERPRRHSLHGSSMQTDE
jgi:hypothetical protein